jgi:hypothetical protein
LFSPKAIFLPSFGPCHRSERYWFPLVRFDGSSGYKPSRENFGERLSSLALFPSCNAGSQIQTSSAPGIFCYTKKKTTTLDISLSSSSFFLLDFFLYSSSVASVFTKGHLFPGNSEHSL